MLNKKPLLGLAALSIFATGTAQADGENNVTFSGTVAPYCGIEVVEATAGLAYGDNYLDSKAIIKLTSNKQVDVNLRATNIDVSSFNNQVQEHEVFFEGSGTKNITDKNSNVWKGGIPFSRSEIDANANLEIAARVAYEESELDASDNYQVATTWTLECN